MPYINNTPEARLGLTRSDSKDPATTCRGITSSGQPCRRDLAPTPDASPQGRGGKRHQKVDLTQFYCWQHKDQAQTSSSSSAPSSSSTSSPFFSAGQPGRQNPGLRPKSSIDTLLDRLGVLDINGGAQNASTSQSRPSEKKKKGRTLCCCFTIFEDDELPTPSVPRPQPSARPQQMQQVSSPPATLKTNLSTRQTNALMKWIPTNSLTPTTISNVLNELAKPISPADEPGYIYMFWVTPPTATSARSAPAGDDISSSSLLPSLSAIAASLLPAAERGMDYLSAGWEDDETPEQIQRANAAIRRARELNTLSSSPSGSGPGAVRLKIGRTSNVHRRLNEWSRQCNNQLTLLRYYPYTPSGRQGQGTATAGLEPGRKVPHVHRVERLIHVELADMRIRDLGPCSECGKEHKEWFEVPAERMALKRVDECIRRWVRWAHTQ
ncbi:meiotically up-regulated gene 113-domain-containing protein [Aspergillus egyptiacus]|nr:meiotically up-regulated gene 113-domain-containing protein [Aspergillus egyptiacus]